MKTELENTIKELTKRYDEAMEAWSDADKTQRAINELERFNDIPPLFEPYKKLALANLRKELETTISSHSH